MQQNVLGCLLDLSCENPQTVKHILTWKGSNENMSAPHFFCEMWREEERQMGVSRQPSGAIAGEKSEWDLADRSHCGLRNVKEPADWFRGGAHCE